MTDAYALMKVLYRQHRERRFKVLVNLVKGQREATQTFRKLDRAAERFLNIRLEYSGIYSPRRLPADGRHRAEGSDRALPLFFCQPSVCPVGEKGC